MALHSHAFAEPPVARWQPVPDGSPVFQRYRSDDTTIKALTLTQVELHKLRTAHHRLSAQAKHDEEEWQRLKTQMEDQLRQVQVRNAEAERLFNDQVSSLVKQLHDKQDRLSQLQQEHDKLKGATNEQIHSLKQQLQELQQSCDDVQARKTELQEQLRKAGLSAESGRKAQQRVAELESALGATRDKAKQMINSLEKQRDEAEAQRQHLQQRLHSTQGELQHQTQLRSHSELEALKMAIERQRLSNALEVERLINAPLRHTNHASSTLAHVMRSAAAGTVASHSTAPHTPSHLTPANNVPLSGDTIAVARPGQEEEQLVINRPSVNESFAGRDLSRLGRSWATTTPTAGLPHPVYLDNIERFRQHYEMVAGASSDKAPTRPSSVPRRYSPVKGGLFLTPQKKKPITSTHSSGRTIYYP